MSLKAVFVDVGNTLVREIPSRYEIYAQTARAHGASIEGPQMRAAMYAAHDELPRVVDGAFRYSDAWFLAYIERVFRLRLGLDAELLPGIQRELFERFSAPTTFALFDGSLELFE